MKIALNGVVTNTTTYSGQLDEKEVEKLLKDAACAQVGLNPDDPAVHFRAYITSDAGGIGPIKKYIKYELTVDHTKQPTQGRP